MPSEVQALWAAIYVQIYDRVYTQMTGSKGTGLSLLPQSRGRVLALLLVGALLLCHGVFGVFHLCTVSSAPVHQDHEHLPLADGAMGTHEHPSCHLAGAEYFAVLFMAFLGLVLGMLLKGPRSWGRITVFRHFERCLPPFFCHRPRGPTIIPVLQVFRL